MEDLGLRKVYECPHVDQVRGRYYKAHCSRIKSNLQILRFALTQILRWTPAMQSKVAAAICGMQPRGFASVA